MFKVASARGRINYGPTFVDEECSDEVKLINTLSHLAVGSGTFFRVAKEREKRKRE